MNNTEESKNEPIFGHDLKSFFKFFVIWLVMTVLLVIGILLSLKIENTYIKIIPLTICSFNLGVFIFMGNHLMRDFFREYERFKKEKGE